MKTEKMTFEPSYEWNNGGTRFQQCDIFYNGENIGFERSCFPWDVFRDPSHRVYPHQLFDEQEAKQLANAFGATVEPEPYSDNLFCLCFEGENHYHNFEAFLNR